MLGVSFTILRREKLRQFAPPLTLSCAELFLDSNFFLIYFEQVCRRWDHWEMCGVVQGTALFEAALISEGTLVTPVNTHTHL